MREKTTTITMRSNGKMVKGKYKIEYTLHYTSTYTILDVYEQQLPMLSTHSDTTKYIHIHIDTLARNSILLLFSSFFFGMEREWKFTNSMPMLCVFFFVRFKFDHIPNYDHSEYAQNAERYVRKRDKNIHRQNSIIIETNPYTISSIVRCFFTSCACVMCTYRSRFSALA